MFIRCEWVPPLGAETSRRLSDVSDVINNDVMIRLAGRAWYRLASSKSSALAKPVESRSLGSPKSWRNTSLAEGTSMHRLSLWNGYEGPMGWNFSSTILEPSEASDVVVLSGSSVGSVRAAGVLWKDILCLGKTLAEKFNGVAIVSSTELMEHAVARELAWADHAAYAVFWGIDNRGVSPSFTRVIASSRTMPGHEVACRDWDEVAKPDDARLHRVARLV